MNNTKVFTLLAAMTALFGLIGGSIGGQSGALIALLIAGAMNFIMYFNSSKMVLKSYRAQVIEPSAASELYATVDRLRQRAGLPCRRSLSHPINNPMHLPPAATQSMR